MKKYLRILLVLVLLAGFSTRVFAATSDTVAFQARVLSKDRLFAPNGLYSFSFSIYSAAGGGTPVWTETWSGSNKLTVRHGVFTVGLGSLTSLGSVDWSSSNLYLQISFDADDNGSFEQSFASRVPVTAVPIALSAKQLDGKDAADLATLAENEVVSGSWSFTNGITLGSLSGLLKSTNGAVGTATAGTDYQAPLTTGDLNGTTNQITVSGGTGSVIGSGVTLNLPQDIGTASSPTFSSLTVGANLNVTGTTTLATSLTGTLKAAAGVISAATPDSDYQQPVSWGDGLIYSAPTASVDYNTTNLKITATQLDTVQSIATGASPTFAGLALGTGSITMIGSLGTTGARLTKGWFTDLEVTNAITGSVTGSSGSTTGNAATVTNGVYTTDTGTVTSTMILNGTIAAADIASGAITAPKLQAAAADLGAADVNINLGNTNGAFNTNLTTDGTITATTFIGNLTGNADTVTTNANLTGPITSVGNATSVAAQTGTGSTFVMNTSPILVTPALGAATYTTLSGGNITDSALTATRVTYAGTAGILQDSANMTFDTTNGLTLAAGSASALNLSSVAGTAVGGILFGADTNLYRSAANTLKTDDALIAGTSLTVSNLSATRIPYATTGGLLTDSANFVLTQTPFNGVATNILSVTALGQAQLRTISTGTEDVSIISATNDQSKGISIGIADSAWRSAPYYNVPAGTAFILADVAATNLVVSTTGTQTFYTGAPASGPALTIDGSQVLWIGTTADTNLYRSAANTLKTDDAFIAATSITDGGLTSGRVTYAGTSGILQDSANMTFNGSTLTIDQGTTSPLVLNRVVASANGPQLQLGKARGAVGTPTVITTGDTLGILALMGYDGTNYITGAQIVGGSEGTVASGQIPGKLIFNTANSAGSLTQSLMIDSSQVVWIGSTADTNLYRSAANTLKTDDSVVIAGTSLDLITQADLRLYDADSSAYVGFQAASAVSSTVVWTLPDADGGAATVLKTNGAGTLYWDTDNTGGVGGSSLDAAYDSGRTITVDAGPIVLNDSGTTTSLFDINQSGAITGAAPVIDVDYSGSISNAADYASFDLTGVTNAGAGNSIGIRISGFDYSLSADAEFVLASTKLATDVDFLSKKPDASGAAFLFDTSATLSTASVFAVNNNGTRLLTLNQLGDLVPGTDNTQDIGSSGLRWQEGYIGGFTLSSSVMTGSADTTMLIKSDQSITNVLDIDADQTNQGWAVYNRDHTVASNMLVHLTQPGQLKINVGSSTGGIVLGDGTGGTWDTNLYRSAANILKTDDALFVAGQLYIGDSDTALTRLAANLISSGTSDLITGQGGLAAGTLNTTAEALLSSYVTIGNADAAIAGSPNAHIYRSSGNGTGMWAQGGNLILQPRSPFSTIFIDGGSGAELMRLTNAGQLQIYNSGSTSGITFGDGAAGYDTNLYRSAANRLKTDDVLIVDPGGSGETGITNFDSGTVALFANGNQDTTLATYSTRNADGNKIGGMRFYGSNDAVSPEIVQYSLVSGSIVNSADGSETGSLSLYTRNNAAGAGYYGRVDIDESGKIWLGPASSSGTGTNDVNLYRSATNVLRTDDTFYAYSQLLVGDSASVRTDASAFIYEYVTSADDFYGTISTAINNGAGDSIGIQGDSYIVNNDTGGDGIGVYGTVRATNPGDSSVLTNAISFYGNNRMYGIATTNSYGLYLTNPTATAVTNSYGAYIADQTVGTTADFGLVIAGADTAALWVGSGADNTDAANGIFFGTSRDTNLYRSAANTLKTDDFFHAVSLNVPTTSTSPDPLQIRPAVSTTALNGIVMVNLQPTLTSDRDAAAITESVLSKITLDTNVDVPGSIKHFHAYDTIKGSGATLVNQYGLYIDSMSAATNNYAVYLAGTGVANGITFGGDTNLYHSAANSLKTDDNFYALSVTETSDLNSKTDIRDISYGLNTVLGLRPVSYHLLEGSQGADLGLIAQEVRNTVPEIVKDQGDGTLGIRYTGLVPVLVKAIQEQQAIIDEVRNQLAVVQQSLGSSTETSTVSLITSPANKDLVLRPSTGKTTIDSRLEVAGAFIVKDINPDDYETDGTEDDSAINTTTDQAAIALGSSQTEVTIPDQGSAQYSVIITWNNDPGQPSWATVNDATHFTVKTAAPLTGDTIFRYLIIDNE